MSVAFKEGVAVALTGQIQWSIFKAKHSGPLFSGLY